MILKKIKSYNPFIYLKLCLIGVIMTLLPALLLSQGTQILDIYKMKDIDSPQSDSVLISDIKNYIRDTLLFGGGEISNISFYGNAKGIGLFKDGADIGFQRGLILSNGYVGTTMMTFGGKRTGADAFPAHDSLGPIRGIDALQNADMNWMAGLISGPPFKPDTAADPTVITFRFKPYYNSIGLKYVFASEEYQYKWEPEHPPNPWPGFYDVDLTNKTDGSDFMAILIRKTSTQALTNANICSVRGDMGNPSWLPVSVEYLNDSIPQPNQDFFVINYENKKSFIFDGATVPMKIFPFADAWPPETIDPCHTYFITIGVADYPNGQVVSGHNLSHQINSAVFLEAFSLISGYGLEWTLEGSVDNPDFASDTSLVEGGCSQLTILVKFNVMPRDTTTVALKIGNAIPSEYIISPPLFQDSLIVIPDSVMEFPIVITALDDNIPEGTGGIDTWNIRYQMDPCDLPIGGQWGTEGYSGNIRVHVRDYNPFVNKTKIYGPDTPPPASQYHCGGQVTVNISDILEGGIPPYYFVWNDGSNIGLAENFTTTIDNSPDWATCTIRDNCSDKPGYVAGVDSVIIKSRLTISITNDFQLCEDDSTQIAVLTTNVGNNYNAEWYFMNNLVGTGPTYMVRYSEYGSWAPNTIEFVAKVTDLCGNIDRDTVNVTFFPVVEIQGESLICLYDTVHLTCSDAVQYQRHYGSLSGPIIGSQQQLNYVPQVAGNHTICVRIQNSCLQWADTCFSFFVSQLICDMKMNNSNNFNTCPNVPFTLQELNGFDGWYWEWEDNGTTYNATGQTITVELNEAGDHDFTVMAYNSDLCWDTITRTVHVYPYANPVASTSIESVCIDYPTDLSIVPTGPVSITNYSWSAVPPDASLSGHQNEPSPTVTPQVTTTYKCVIRDNNGCYDSAYIDVNVRPRLDGAFQASPDFNCTDRPVQIGFNPIVFPLPDANYHWTFDDGVPATYDQLTPPQIIWSTPGIKNVTLHISELGCDSTFRFQYTIYPDPLAAFSASGNFGCQPITVSFSNSSSNLENPTYLWDFGDGSTATETNPTHVYEIPGIYDITLTVTNSTGCINTLTINDLVEVYEVPVADFEADPQTATIDNPTIKFTEKVNIPFALIRWNFGDSTNVSTEINPRHTYGAPGIYEVVMYTETEHGCWDRDTLEIGIVEDIKIFVPNAFSPNGDGKNECFSIGGTTNDIIDIFQVIIYSRWGKEIYNAPVTDPNCVWDGRDGAGNIMPGDTYIYRIFGKNMRGAKKVYEGMVTIVL